MPEPQSRPSTNRDGSKLRARLFFRALALLASILIVPQIAHSQIELIGGGTVDPNGLNFGEGDATRFSLNVNGRTYQRPPLVTFKGYQYAVYYDSNRNVCLARRSLTGADWDILRFTDYTMPGSDSHNVVTLGICATDGTIHLAFDNHADALNYRVSSTGAATNPDSIDWNVNLFGPVLDRFGSAGTPTRFTYPYFFNAPNGNLMLYYREGGSGNGNGMLLEYDGTQSDWTAGLGKFISSEGSYSGNLSSNSQSRNPYLNAIAYAGDRIHISWGWRESSGGSQFNHDLCYAYSDDNGRTWFNNDGIQIGTTGASFISVDSPGLVVADIPQNQGLSNQYTHYAYPDGSCHVMVAHNQVGTETRRYHHYWRNAEGIWNSASLPFSGSRPKLVGDRDGSLFLVYGSGGQLRIAKGVPNAEQSTWAWTSIYTQPGVTEAGEGQIDYTRWEYDRVLSVYGQERPTSVTNYGSGTPIDSPPSAVHVFDFQVSSSAIRPQPASGAHAMSHNVSLNWDAGLEAVSHRIYFGADIEAVANADTHSPEYMGEQNHTSFEVARELSGLADYHWRIDQVLPNNRIITGSLWRFATKDGDPTINPVTFAANTEAIDFTYRRSKSEIAGGATYQVETSENLSPNSWTTNGIVQSVEHDTGDIQTVKATLLTPAVNGKRFLRLKAGPHDAP